MKIDEGPSALFAERLEDFVFSPFCSALPPTRGESSLSLFSLRLQGRQITVEPMATTAPASKRASLGAATTAATTKANADADAASPSSSSREDLAFQTALVLEWLAERSAGTKNADALVATLAEAKVRGRRRG